MRYFCFLLVLFVCSCSRPEKEPPLTINQASFKELPGWEQDDLRRMVPAFEKSCTRIIKTDSTRLFGPLIEAGTYENWQNICHKFLEIDRADLTALRKFFEDNFQPWKAVAGRGIQGLFTGYYEASLQGSLERYGSYEFPLYRRPDDLVMVDLGEFRDDLKGRRIAGRVKSGRLRPYESRPDIVGGNWPHNDQVLAWVNSPVDAFFVQIQGSGVIEMPDGSIMRIGYDGQNGHPYYAIGRELLKRKYLDKKDVSMQSIRSWLENNPGKADEIMNTNKSYVFFRELHGAGPMGGEGVALTPGRSLAIDRSKIPYGMPVWVDIDSPTEEEDRMRRLMVTQDTGGAIRGAVRGDIFWGYGSKAEHLAGHMKSEGRYWFLLPR